MFWNNFLSLCNQRGTSPTSVVTELGISIGSVTHWKNGKIPHNTTLMKLADYFNVTIEQLTGKPDKY
ncbi:MAG: helix-turn-helix transcriptional regulator, partial [Clostridia bacterium]|nr:helix-turn-helix transcriptional regulator [Clostridia bacterium]